MNLRLKLILAIPVSGIHTRCSGSVLDSIQLAKWKTQTMVNISDNLKILCVDDEQDVLFIVSTALKQEGYEVSTASNGIEGLEVAKEVLPDAIVLDVMMPKMDGFEVLEKLNEDETTRNIPVVMLTGLSEKTKKLDAIDQGVRFYMVKPFEPHELIAKVQLAIKTAKGEESF